MFLMCCETIIKEGIIMNKDDTIQFLIGVFKKYTGYNFENEELSKENFFSPLLNIPVRNIVLSLYAIEGNLEIELSTEKIEDGKFCTFEDVVELVKSVR